MAYNAKDITVLKGLEPVRERPGMYIGSTGPSGLHHLVWELLDNSVDEAMAGECTKIDITLLADGACRVTDNGRGIPTDPHPEYRGKSGDQEKALVAALEKTMTKIVRHQTADGGFAGNAGWAPTLSVGICNKSIVRAKERGAQVDQKALERIMAQAKGAADNTAPAAVPPAEMHRVEQSDDVYGITYPARSYTFLAWNTRHPLFGSAKGLWIEARGALRWPDDGEREESIFAFVSWHSFVLTPLVRSE